MNEQMTGEFIAEMRKERGMTQIQLADMLSVSNRTISKWECGNGFPDVYTIPLLCEILDISIDELFKGEREEKVKHSYCRDKFVKSQVLSKKTKRHNNAVAILLFTLSLLISISILTIIGVFSLPHFIKVFLLICGISLILMEIVAVKSFLCIFTHRRCMYCNALYIPSITCSFRQILFDRENCICPDCKKSD